MVTHDDAIAARSDRIVRLVSGLVEDIGEPNDAVIVAA